MKFKVCKGSGPEQKLGKNTKNGSDTRKTSVSPTPFAKFVKEKDFHSKQTSGTFVKKSKGKSFKVNNDEAGVQESFVEPEKEEMVTKIKKNQNKFPWGNKMLFGSITKLPKFQAHNVLDKKIDFQFVKTCKNSGKKAFDALTPEAASEASVNQTKTKRNFNSSNRSVELSMVKQKSPKEISEDTLTELNVHNEQIVVSKKLSKKKKQKNGVRNVPEKRALLDSVQDSDVLKSQKCKKKKRKHEDISPSDAVHGDTNHEVIVDTPPNDVKCMNQPGSDFGKKKRSFSESSGVMGIEESCSTDRNSLTDITVQSKKKRKKNFENLATTSSKQVVTGTTKKSICKQRKSLQLDTSERRNSVPRSKSKEPEDTSDITVRTDNENFQGKKKKRKEHQLLENFDVISDSIKSHPESTEQTENFRLDYEGSENKKQKKKQKKNFVSSFDDIMQDTSTGVVLNTKFRKASIKNIPESASPKKDSSYFIKLNQNELRGFEGREDTPERLNRTVFVGNLPLSFNSKLVQKLFQNIGKTESVRLRSAVPARSTVPKKVAMIKKEFHSESNSFNAYVVFKNEEDVEKAVTLNKTVVQGHHIRVNRFKPTNTYDNKRSVFLGNLPYNVHDETLWEAFGECGNIELVRVIRDSKTGVGKGFGFVVFEESGSVEKALLLNETEVGGRCIRVHIAEEGNKSKVNSPVGNRRTKPKIEKKNVRKSGWRPAGQLKTKKKLMKKRMGIKKKKLIASMFTNK